MWRNLYYFLELIFQRHINFFLAVFFLFNILLNFLFCLYPFLGPLLIHSLEPIPTYVQNIILSVFIWVNIICFDLLLWYLLLLSNLSIWVRWWNIGLLYLTKNLLDGHGDGWSSVLFNCVLIFWILWLLSLLRGGVMLLLIRWSGLFILRVWLFVSSYMFVLFGWFRLVGVGNLHFIGLLAALTAASIEVLGIGLVLWVLRVIFLILKIWHGSWELDFFVFSKIWLG